MPGSNMGPANYGRKPDYAQGFVAGTRWGGTSLNLGRRRSLRRSPRRARNVEKSLRMTAQGLSSVRGLLSIVSFFRAPEIEADR